MKILLSGGGTGGSVAPLLAISEELKLSYLKNNEVKFLWIGTKKGIECEMVVQENIKYKGIFSGKLRRYFSWKNFIDPIFIILGFIQSLWTIFVFKPDIILTAGSFVAVPVVWAGWILRVPTLVHQQDVKIGLANKLMMPFSKIITCTLKETAENFNENKNIYFTGNAIRKKIFHSKKERAIKEFKLDKSLPTVLFLGGGTGALSLNKIIIQSLENLLEFCQVIHITGKDKLFFSLPKEGFKHYHSFQFLSNIEKVYSVADLVVTRAGMSVLSELAVLGKPAIMVPISDSHQEANANYFSNRDAAILLTQKDLNSEKLVNTIKSILLDNNKKSKLSFNIKRIIPKDGAARIAKLILELKNREKR